eukprot:Selendium_serpulae@DN1988_c0_g1_i2.p1
MTIQSSNPRTGALVKEYQTHTDAEITEILSEVHEVYKSWKVTPIAQRAAAIRRFSEILISEKTALGELINSEMGKPEAEAQTEVDLMANMCAWYADNAEMLLADEECLPGKYFEFVTQEEYTKTYISYRPMGTVFLVMPWNYPFLQILRTAVPNLLAGNTIVLKHSSNVVGCSLMAEEMVNRAVQGGATKWSKSRAPFRSVIASRHQSELIISHPSVCGTHLTGGVAAGKVVAQLCGKYLKKVVLELGGNDAYLILKDADLDKAVHSLCGFRYYNAGQTCVSPKRLIVDASVKEELEKKVVAFITMIHTTVSSVSSAATRRPPRRK